VIARTIRCGNLRDGLAAAATDLRFLGRYRLWIGGEEQGELGRRERRMAHRAEELGGGVGAFAAEVEFLLLD
jgi:hypothetical protein